MVDVHFDLLAYVRMVGYDVFGHVKVKMGRKWLLLRYEGPLLVVFPILHAS